MTNMLRRMEKTWGYFWTSSQVSCWLKLFLVFGWWRGYCCLLLVLEPCWNVVQRHRDKTVGIWFQKDTIEKSLALRHRLFVLQQTRSLSPLTRIINFWWRLFIEHGVLYRSCWVLFEASLLSARRINILIPLGFLPSIGWIFSLDPCKKRGSSKKRRHLTKFGGLSFALASSWCPSLWLVLGDF